MQIRMHVIYVYVILILHICLDTRVFFLNVYAVSHLKSIKINPALAPIISQVFLNTDEQNSFYGK